MPTAGGSPASTALLTFAPRSGGPCREHHQQFNCSARYGIPPSVPANSRRLRPEPFDNNPWRGHQDRACCMLEARNRFAPGGVVFDIIPPGVSEEDETNGIRKVFSYTCRALGSCRRRRCADSTGNDPGRWLVGSCRGRAGADRGSSHQHLPVGPSPGFAAATFHHELAISLGSGKGLLEPPKRGFSSRTGETGSFGRSSYPEVGP